MEKLNKKTKILIVTGGVFSSLGKGVACSSIGTLLKYIGYKTVNMKFDPYLNVDAGTMSPLQHGEVFVTRDGHETDLDIGNYERFLNIDLNKDTNITAGRVYYDVLNGERDGEFLGSTIQVVPHITGCIVSKMIKVSNEYDADFLVVEVGGTIGDIESIPFVEACRQIHAEYKDRVVFLHTVPLIELLTSKEEKTKPLQHSVRELMHLGVTPHFLMIRSKKEMTQKTKEKISLTTGIELKNIFSLTNQEHIYFLPESLLNQKLHERILEKFNMTPISNSNSLGRWSEFTKKILSPKKYKANIALIGKYVEIPDAYLSVTNSLELSSFYLETELKIDMIDSTDINESNVYLLKKYDGILIPGGFGERGIEGMLLAIKYARENNVPYFGICLGMQLATIEYARNVLGWKDANSTEFNKRTNFPVIDIIAGKNDDKNLGGTLRLGDYECVLKPNSIAQKCYQKNVILERHRHRYEFNNKYKNEFESKGLVFSGVHLEKNLIEIIELPNHRFFIGCQFHPEFTSKTLRPNPIFLNFVNFSKKRIN
ncbi:MAG: CTP synthase [Malacoplasma sp.]|nr:CTP synthase [Malacoplasma sp.]